MSIAVPMVNELNFKDSIQSHNVASSMQQHCHNDTVTGGARDRMIYYAVHVRNTLLKNITTTTL